MLSSETVQKRLLTLMFMGILALFSHLYLNGQQETACLKKQTLCNNGIAKYQYNAGYFGQCNCRIVCNN